MYHTKLRVRKLKSEENMYELVEPLRFKCVRVPIGFRTDFASVPKQLQWLYTPQGKYSRASVIHDYLYASAEMPRLEADIIFYQAMKADGVDFITRNIFYWTVRYFGEENYAK